MEDRLKEFELYVFSKGIKLDEINEDIVNEYCTDIFYDAEDEEQLEELNEIEDLIRKTYLKESK